MGERIYAARLLKDKSEFLDWLLSLDKRRWFKQGNERCPISQFLTDKTGRDFIVEYCHPPVVKVIETKSFAHRASEEALLPHWAKEFDVAFQMSRGRMTVDRVIEIAEWV